MQPDEPIASTVLNQVAVTVRSAEVPGNPFLVLEPKIEQLINLYNAKVVNIYKGKKNITLAGTIDEI
ncbi:MFS transporter permease, partial [Yersinia enterocolitica]